MSDLQVDSELSAQEQALASLISRIARGDEQAMGVLYDRTSSHVYSLALRVLDDSTMAEEVTLDVYMQVWKQASRFNPDRGKPIVWLAVLTRSRAIDRLRVGQKERVSQKYLDDVGEQIAIQGDPETLSVYCDQNRIVQKALASLSLEQREVIEMAYFGGLSQSEIAIQINKPLGTVKTRVRLGMTNLRKVLDPLFAECAL